MGALKTRAWRGEKGPGIRLEGSPDAIHRDWVGAGHLPSPWPRRLTPVSRARSWHSVPAGTPSKHRGCCGCFWTDQAPCGSSPALPAAGHRAGIHRLSVLAFPLIYLVYHLAHRGSWAYLLPPSGQSPTTASLQTGKGRIGVCLHSAWSPVILPEPCEQECHLHVVDEKRRLGARATRASEVGGRDAKPPTGDAPVLSSPRLQGLPLSPGHRASLMPGVPSGNTAPNTGLCLQTPLRPRAGSGVEWREEVCFWFLPNLSLCACVPTAGWVVWTWPEVSSRVCDVGSGISRPTSATAQPWVAQPTAASEVKWSLGGKVSPLQSCPLSLGSQGAPSAAQGTASPWPGV